MERKREEWSAKCLGEGKTTLVIGEGGIKGWREIGAYSF